MSDYIIATLAQIAFFPLAVVMFGRMEKAAATSLVVLMGLAFLPEVTLFSITDAVQISKDRIIYLATLLGFLVHQNRAFLLSRPVMALVAVLIPMMIVNVFSGLYNAEAIFSQGRMHKGLGLFWLIGQTIDDIFTIGLPFIIAKAAFSSFKDLRTLLYVMVSLGIFYTGLVLIEVLLSIPFHSFQFQRRIFDISSRPEIRYGLTEPMVFLGSGHKLTTFMITIAIAAAAFAKIGPTVFWGGIKKGRLISTVGLLATVKTGSIVLGFGVLTVFAIFKPKKIALIASLSAAMLCLYPISQVFDLFPEDVLVEIATSYTNKERGRSFGGRFEEEEFILERLGERLYFGCGTYARIPDGDIVGAESGEPGLDPWWVIKMGMSGIVGLEVVLLILCVPIWKARKRIASMHSNEEILLMCALMMCIVVRMVDLMLNGWWNSLPVFFAGALYAVSTHAHRLPNQEYNPDDEQQRIPSQRYAGDVRFDR